MMSLQAAIPALAAQDGGYSQIWINFGSYSRHFDHGRNFREDNVGFGVEAWLTGNHGLMAGTFINSDRVRSHYAAYHWRPLHWQWSGIQLGAAGTVTEIPAGRCECLCRPYDIKPG